MNVTSKTVFNDELYKRLIKPFRVTQLITNIILLCFLTLLIIVGFLVSYVAFIPCAFIVVIFLVSFITGRNVLKNVSKNMKEKYSSCTMEFEFYDDGFSVNYILDDSFSTVDYEKSDVAQISRKDKLTYITLTNNELLIVDETNIKNIEIYNQLLKEYV